MKLPELLFYAVAGWTGIGVAGVTVSLVRGRRAEAWKHSMSIAVVAGVYLFTLLAVSVAQRQRVLRMGQEQCYGDLCFAVTAADQVPGLVAGDDGRVVRVTVWVENHGSATEADDGIKAYLVDSRGRIWTPLPGLSGNRLNGRVAAGSQMTSQPMFRVAEDSAGLGMVLTHGNWQSRRLVIGESDSLGHRKNVVALDPR